MPHRALLSSEQRTRLYAIAVDPAEMARHYVLSTQDQVLVRAKRRASNPAVLVFSAVAVPGLGAHESGLGIRARDPEPGSGPGPASLRRTAERTKQPRPQTPTPLPKAESPRPTEWRA